MKKNMKNFSALQLPCKKYAHIEELVSAKQKIKL